MECGTCGKPEEKGRIGGFIVNKTRQIGVGMTTNNIRRGRGERERDVNTGEEPRSPHTCQGELEGVSFDIMDKGDLYMWD